MFRRRFVVVVVVITFLVVVGRATVSADDWQDEDLRDEKVDEGGRAEEEEEVVRSIRRRRRWVGVPRCKQRNESCSGFPRCCDKLRCLWEAGFNPFQTGVCVTCVNRDQICQTDGQCCGSLVCQKSTRYQIDGKCDEKRADASECHDDDQCQSNLCVMTWIQLFKGQGGKCTPRKTS